MINNTFGLFVIICDTNAFISTHSPSQESERSYLCVLGISILTQSTIFDSMFSNCSDSVVVLVFHLLLNLYSYIIYHRGLLFANVTIKLIILDCLKLHSYLGGMSSKHITTTSITYLLSTVVLYTNSTNSIMNIKSVRENRRAIKDGHYRDT